MTALAVGLTTGRFIIHWRKSRKIRCDDVFNAAAAILLVAYTTTYQLYVPSNYEAQLYNMGIIDKSPLGYDPVRTVKYTRANVLLFWLVIYAVKASFLALYWEIFHVSRRFRIAWMVLAVYTALSFFATWFSYLWRCGSPKDLVNLRRCSITRYQKPQHFSANLLEEVCQTIPTSRIIRMLSMWCALNVFGDILRMLSSQLYT